MRCNNDVISSDQISMHKNWKNPTSYKININIVAKGASATVQAVGNIAVLPPAFNNLNWTNKYEPPRDKTNRMTVRPAKTQISLGIRPVWSESSLSAWRKLGSLAAHWAHSEDSDQTGQMHRLIWVFSGRTATLLVLSWGGSYLVNNMIYRYGFISTVQETCHFMYTFRNKVSEPPSLKVLFLDRQNDLCTGKEFHSSVLQA